ncbi:MAG: hypothetical protein M3Y08_10020 [Fibrobacterota bacterium]|nr:hypothetical protein [Fibrobacterota bacterium]
MALSYDLVKEITVILKNETNFPITLYSHGGRLDYRSDAVPGMGLPVVDSSGTFSYISGMIYMEPFADSPRSSEGSYDFDAADRVGSLDGLHILPIFLNPRTGLSQFDLDTVREHVSIP